MADPLQLQRASAAATQALIEFTGALLELRRLDDDPTVQGMLDSLLEQVQEADEQLQLYQEELSDRWQHLPPAVTATPELIREYAARIVAPDGLTYVAQVYGEQHDDNTWIGWIRFVASPYERDRLTEPETTQPSREALAYWAAGLEPIYFEGAFARSVDVDV